jgi:hypothetical protein
MPREHVMSTIFKMKILLWADVTLCRIAKWPKKNSEEYVLYVVHWGTLNYRIDFAA